MLNYTQQFLLLVKQLKNNGNSYASIARRIGIKGQKISDMKAGRSSASQDLINQLHTAYPELSGKPLNLQTTIEGKIKVAVEEIGEELIRRLSKTSDEARRQLEKRLEILEVQVQDLLNKKDD